MEYTKLDPQVPANINATPYNLALPFSSTGKNRRVLFIVEHVPTDDLISRRLLSGAGLSLLKNLVNYGFKFIEKPITMDSFDWFAVNWNEWKTYGLDQDFVNTSQGAFKRRIMEVIRQYDPTSIVILGASCLLSLVPEYEIYQYANSNIYGVPLLYTAGTGADGKRIPRIPITCVPALEPILKDRDIRGNGPTNLAGYVSRSLLNGVLGRLKYKISGAFNAVLVDTMPAFDQLLSRITTSKVVAIDSETDGLWRRSARLLTIQFSCVEDMGEIGYVLPIYHKDTPFSPKQLGIIVDKLREYFITSANDYNIYQGGHFDLSIFSENLKVPFFKAPIWDIQVGEYALDENMKFLSTYYRNPQYSSRSLYYNLKDLAIQYGWFGYVDSDFKKEARVTIKDVPLTPEVVEYCAADVCIPMQIHKRQQQRAYDLGYTHYKTIVLGPESDKIHAFASMEYAGIPVDSNWLLYLQQDDSPISKELAKQEAALLQMPSIQRLNATLLKEQGAPSKTLWGKPPMIVSLHKENHRQRLFFNILGLQPLDTNKKGGGRLDKAFKAHYAKSVPEVKALEDMEIARKLENTFSHKLAESLQDDLDFQKDGRVRPSFKNWPVVTGRVAEEKPNMQQIPNSQLGKHIKRTFVSGEGCLYIKADYSAHEIRCWGLISHDTELAKVFQHGKELRDQYKRHPTPALANRVFLEGDPHRHNVEFFFEKDLKTIDLNELAKLRKSIKSIFFGLIYGMWIGTLAKNLNHDVEFVEALVSKLYARFKKAAKWLKNIEKQAEETYYVESPLRRRRNLFHYLIPRTSDNYSIAVKAADRKARNSPIQGMASDMNFISVRNLTEKVYLRSLTLNTPPGLQPVNVVHDSQETIAQYSWLLWSLKAVEISMTTDVERICRDKYQFDFVVGLEIDMEIGPDLSHMQAWDWSLAELIRIIAESLVWQVVELGYQFDPLCTIKEIFSHIKEGPQFLNIQWNRQKSTIDLEQAIQTAIDKIQPKATEYAKTMGFLDALVPNESENTQ